jgi:hypothetical protein
MAAQHATTCKSYDDFKQLLQDIRDKNRDLNPNWGVICGPHGPYRQESQGIVKAVPLEFMRGGLVRIMAAWEAYVQDLLGEAFDIIVSQLVEARAAHSPSSVSGCPLQLLKKVIGYRIDPSGETKQVDKVKANATDLAVDLYLEKPYTRITLFQEHKQRALDQFTTPTFYGKHGIDAAFKALFGIDDDLSTCVIQGEVKYSFQLGKNGNSELTVADKKILNDIIRLYYGARCVFVHGQKERNFSKNAALDQDHFTKNHFCEMKRTMNQDIIEKFRGFYDRLRDHGRNAHINYFTIVNLQRFVMVVALHLFRAVAKLVYDKFKIRIWGHSDRMYQDEEESISGLDLLDEQEVED